MKGKLPEGIIWRTINNARVAINPKTGMAVAGAGGRLKGVTLNWYDDMGPMPSHLRQASKPSRTVDPAKPSDPKTLQAYRASQIKASEEDAADQKKMADEGWDAQYMDGSPNLEAMGEIRGKLVSELQKLQKRATPEAAADIAAQISALERVAPPAYAEAMQKLANAEAQLEGKREATAELDRIEGEMSAKKGDSYPALDEFMAVRRKATAMIQRETRRQLNDRAEKILQKKTSADVTQDDMERPKADPGKTRQEANARNARLQKRMANIDAAIKRGPDTATRMSVDGQEAYVTKNSKSGFEITTIDGKVHKGSSLADIQERTGLKIEAASRMKQLGRSSQGYKVAKDAAKATRGKGDEAVQKRREELSLSKREAEKRAAGSEAYKRPDAARYLDRYDTDSLQTSVDYFARRTPMADAAAEAELSAIRGRLRARTATRGDRDRVIELQTEASAASESKKATRDLARGKALADEYGAETRYGKTIGKLASKVESGKASRDEIAEFNRTVDEMGRNIGEHRRRVQAAGERRARETEQIRRDTEAAGGYKPPTQTTSRVHAERQKEIDKLEKHGDHAYRATASETISVDRAARAGLDLAKERAALRAAVSRANMANDIAEKKMHLTTASQIAADMDKRASEHLYKMTKPREDAEWGGTQKDGGKKRIISYIGPRGEKIEEKAVVYGDFAVVKTTGAGTRGEVKISHVPSGAVISTVQRNKLADSRETAKTMISELDKLMRSSGVDPGNPSSDEIAAGLPHKGLTPILSKAADPDFVPSSRR